jgi:hypothetical protein
MKTGIKNKKLARRNPVAKHAGKFNRSAKHKDRKKALKSGETKYRRKSLE